jgi:DNA-binding GntR family transcriptional regulator
MRLSEQAYRRIKEKIITLDLAPSSVIDEQELMEELGLGRTPIREALQRLDSEGLVTIVPRRGTFVADISVTDLQKIFELRIILEGFCARVAAQRITDDQILGMEKVLRSLNELEQVENGKAVALMDVDRQFHELLYRAANNEFLADSLGRFYDLSLRLWYLVLNRLGDVHSAVKQHQKVLKALKAGDQEQAERLIQKHITQFQQSIKAVL